MEGFSPAQAYEIVDCLLPGQVRSVGGRVYLTPRRPTRTTAADCKTRGGEFNLYDRANYTASLQVWKPRAEEGDAEAQTFVGMLYERGVDGPPDYAAAVDWYRRAADQNYAQAQFQLGTLYERGLGVEKNSLEAMNLYRKAQGVSDDDLIYQSTARKMLEQQRSELEEKLNKLQQQLEERGTQIGVLEEQIAQIDAGSEGAAQKIATLQGLVDILEAERQGAASVKVRTQEQLEALPPAQPPIQWPDDKGRMPRSKSFGRYFALIIGVQNYSVFDSLRTPLSDASRIAQLLETKYGFQVISLRDPSNVLIKKSVNDLFDTVGEKDNLLVYFAGRGNRVPIGNREAGYWLPTNAERPPDDTYWVANEFVTNHLARIKAHRVLIVSDSAYAGLISDDPNLLIGEGYDKPIYVKYKLPRRSRLLLASGGDFPLADSEAGENSVFARAFIDALESNSQILSAPALYQRIGVLLKGSVDARAAGFVPELKAIGAAGHELGDFFFVPVGEAG
jgi:hypothetical protein